MTSAPCSTVAPPQSQSEVLIINCDKKPYVPIGFTLPDKNHRKGGQIVFDPTHFSLWTPMRGVRGSLTGNDVLRLAQDKPLANCCVIDFLSRKQDRTPLEWTGKVFTLGTIYESGKNRYARYLNQTVPFGFVCDPMWLGLYWDENCHVLLYTPPKS